MMPHEHYLDRLLKEQIKREIDSQPVPPEARERVRKALGLSNDNHGRLALWKRSSLAIVAGLLAVFFALSLAFPHQTTAFGVKLLRSFEVLVERRVFNISQHYGSDRAPGTAPPIETSYSQQDVLSSLDEVKSRAPFVVLLPDYLPEGVELDAVRFSGSPPLVHVTLQYRGPGGTIRIRESGFTDNLGRGAMYDADDTRVEKVSIQGVEGVIMRNNSGKSWVAWFMQGVSFTVEGTYQPGELLKIAQNLNKPL